MKVLLLGFSVLLCASRASAESLSFYFRQGFLEEAHRDTVYFEGKLMTLTFVAAGRVVSGYWGRLEGRYVFVKVANRDPRSKQRLAWAEENHRVLIQNPDWIGKLPAIYGWDPNAGVLITEAIRGETLSWHFRAEGGISPELEIKLRDFHAFVLDWERQTGERFDMNPDNLVISKLNEVFLVDTEYLGEGEVGFYIPFDQALEKWRLYSQRSPLKRLAMQVGRACRTLLEHAH